MRPDFPGASRAGSGDWALDCDVSTTMLAASIKDVISILAMSVCAFCFARSSRGPLVEPFRRTGIARHGVFCRGLDEIALIADGILVG
jgi:hypothetical protein